jgi:hypothetical protein
MKDSNSILTAEFAENAEMVLLINIKTNYSAVSAVSAVKFIYLQQKLINAVASSLHGG